MPILFSGITLYLIFVPKIIFSFHDFTVKIIHESGIYTLKQPNKRKKKTHKTKNPQNVKSTTNYFIIFLKSWQGKVFLKYDTIFASHKKKANGLDHTNLKI